MSFPAKAVLFDLPLKQENAAKVTLQLVVNTGNIQIMTVASLEGGVLRTLVDLERDHVKIDAWRVAHEEPVLSSNQTFSRSARRRAVTYRIPESTMRRSPQLQIAQRNCWRTFHVNETDSWHCCRLNLASSRGAPIRRIERNLRREMSASTVCGWELSKSMSVPLSLHTCEECQKERTSANCTAPFFLALLRVPSCSC